MLVRAAYPIVRPGECISCESMRHYIVAYIDSVNTIRRETTISYYCLHVVYRYKDSTRISDNYRFSRYNMYLRTDSELLLCVADLRYVIYNVQKKEAIAVITLRDAVNHPSSIYSNLHKIRF